MDLSDTLYPLDGVWSWTVSRTVLNGQKLPT